MRILPFFFLLILFLACNKKDELFRPPPAFGGVERVQTDKSRYNPGELVAFSLNLNKSFSGEVRVTYKYLTDIVGETTLPADGESLSWQWQPPAEDFRGYLVEIRFEREGEVQAYASTAVDVSSDWTRFPRYGFLSDFSPSLTPDQRAANLDRLRDFHINGIQFYDWHNKHHAPLKMSGDDPAATWRDIARRTISLNTVDAYIQEAKARNMASMLYNLLYGAWDDYAADGVSGEWRLFKDPNHQTPDKHDLDDNWAQSDIYVLNPANTGWQDYIFQQTALVYEHLGFDGWHLDQLGDRGNLYDYAGNFVLLRSTFTPFLENLHTAFPDKKMALNAVNQYGQAEILDAPVDFAYTEVWGPNDTYNALAKIVRDNSVLSGQGLNTVLAAYVNYGLADSPGAFNPPAVLMADAVIMAFGGAHLEWGEHLLGKEYFPNDNLSVSDELYERLIEYYDFMTAYQNLLRGGEPVDLKPGILSDEVAVKDWGAELGYIAAIGKTVGDRAVYHLLNFTGLSHLDWRDDNGTQIEPEVQKDFTLKIPAANASRVIYTSPDWRDGVQQELDFVLENGYCLVEVPELGYWGVVVVE